MFQGGLKAGAVGTSAALIFRVSCKLDFPAEDEKIAGEKLRRSRRNDIIKKNAAEKAESQRQDEYRKSGLFCGKNIKTPATGRKEVCNEDKRRSGYPMAFPSRTHIRKRRFTMTTGSSSA